MPRRRKRSCYSDEHYVPVLLATLGLDNETTCSGNTVHVSWQSGTGARGLGSAQEDTHVPPHLMCPCN